MRSSTPCHVLLSLCGLALVTPLHLFHIRVDPRHSKSHTALLGELERVGHQVERDLADAQRVSGESGRY